MTKCIVLGEQPTEVKKKPIEFMKWINLDLEVNECSSYPNNYKNLELVCRDYRGSGCDMIYAYSDSRDTGCMYFGKWNDGVAE